MKPPPSGLTYRKTIVVTPALCVPAMDAELPGFRGMPEVLATAKMIAFIELTCIEALAPYLEDGERTVGTAVNITHSAATPAGVRVTAHVQLLAVEGRRLRFQAECRDEQERIGAGTHERALIELARFQDATERKRPARA